MPHGFASTGNVTPEVRDYDVTRNFILQTEDGQQHVKIGETIEVLFSGAGASKFRCRATGGKWLPADKHLSEVLDTRMKPMKVAKPPVPVEEISSFVVTGDFELVPKFDLTEGQIVEINLRNGAARGIRTDPHLLWTVAADELSKAIGEGLLVKVENGGQWVPCVVTVPFFVNDVGFAKDDEVEVKGDLIRHKGSGNHLSADPDHLRGWLVPMPPEEPPPETPDLEGPPLAIALNILPTIKEVFPWVPGHDWNITSPMKGIPKADIFASLGQDWYVEFVIGVDDTVGILTREETDGGSHPVYREKSRVVFGSHSWDDFVGWLSVVAGMVPHPVEVKGYKFLTTQTVEIGENRWGKGHIIHMMGDDSDDQVRELVASGAMVPFFEHGITGCEGCWHYNNGCTRPERYADDPKCEDWTLEEPPPPPPKKRSESLCRGCKYKRTDPGSGATTCVQGSDTTSTDDCLLHQEKVDDIPF